MPVNKLGCELEYDEHHVLNDNPGAGQNDKHHVMDDASGAGVASGSGNSVRIALAVWEASALTRSNNEQNKQIQARSCCK